MTVLTCIADYARIFLAYQLPFNPPHAPLTNKSSRKSYSMRETVEKRKKEDELCGRR